MPACIAQLGPVSVKNWAAKYFGPVFVKSGWKFLLGNLKKHVIACNHKI